MYLRVNPATADRLVQFALVPMLLGIAFWLGGLKISAMMLGGGTDFLGDDLLEFPHATRGQDQRPDP